MNITRRSLICLSTLAIAVGAYAQGLDVSKINEAIGPEGR
jgi:hypothetical protein